MSSMRRDGGDVPHPSWQPDVSKKIQKAIQCYTKKDFSGMAFEVGSISDHFPHKQAYLSLSFLRQESFENCRDAMEAYRSLLQNEHFIPDPVWLLVLALEAKHKKDSHRHKMFSSIYFDFLPHSKIFGLSEDIPSSKSVSSAINDSPSTAAALWQSICAKENFYSKAMDDLMSMIGLESLKRQTIEFYQRVQAELKVKKESRVPMTLNFLFLGNPGLISILKFVSGYGFSILLLN